MRKVIIEIDVNDDLLKLEDIKEAIKAIYKNKVTNVELHEPKVHAKKQVDKMYKEDKVQEIDYNILIENKEVQMESDVEDYLDRIKKNLKRVNEVNDIAKSRKTLAGRIVRFPMGDGYAYYQVILVSDDKCVVRQIIGLGDDWMIRDLGIQSAVELKRITPYLMN